MEMQKLMPGTPQSRDSAFNTLIHFQCRLINAESTVSLKWLDTFPDMMACDYVLCEHKRHWRVCAGHARQTRLPLGARSVYKWSRCVPVHSLWGLLSAGGLQPLAECVNQVSSGLTRWINATSHSISNCTLTAIMSVNHNDCALTDTVYHIALLQRCMHTVHLLSLTPAYLLGTHKH